MDITRNMRSNLTALIYICFLIGGVICRSQQPLHELPKFLPTSDNFTFKVGQVAVLECSIDNLDDKKVIWRLASDPSPLTVGYMSFSEDPRYAVEHDRDGTKWNLVIRDVQLKDAGVYECQVSSRMRHLRHHVTLFVTEPSPTTTPRPNLSVDSGYKSYPGSRSDMQISSDDGSSFSNIEIRGSNYVDEGDRIYLVCNATSEEYPPEDIDWFRAGNTLTTDDNRGMFIHKYVSLSTGTIYSTLEIKHARLTDQGVYVCRTSNKDVTSTQVNVLNGDTYNVKRGTVKKDSTSAMTDNSGNRFMWTMTSLLMAVFTSLLYSRCHRYLDLT